MLSGTFLFAGGNKDAASKTAVKPTVLRFNSVKTSLDPDYLAWVEMYEKIEAASNGTLVIEKFASEALGKAADMIEAIKMGDPIIQDGDTGHLAIDVPDFAVMQHPYLVTEPGQVEYLWKSEWGQGLTKQLEKKGLHLISVVYFGKRHLIGNKPVLSRADTKGMLIRHGNTKMMLQMVIALGGNPTMTAWGETYQALSQGVVDAAESPFALLYSAKLYEVAKEISLTGHLLGNTIMVMSQSVYDSLAPEAKAALDKYGAEQCKIFVDMVTSQEDEWKAKLAAEGVRFNDVDTRDFVAAAAGISKAFPEWTPGVYDKVKDILKGYRP
jgi:tripartite ATP-independent transporter DctP family solute receptor